MKTDIYTETPPSSPSLSSGTSLLQAVPNTKKTERKRKRLSDYLPIPLILPSILLSLLLLSISQAQTTHATPLFQEDFHWANNAWNSNKTAISPIESLHFEGKAYMSRRCVKIASSSQTGSIHTRITEIPPGRIQLIVRGARYDKAKESRLHCLFLHGKDTLHRDSLHFSSYYKDGDMEPYRQYDSMTQNGNGFASTDTSYWENTTSEKIEELVIVIQADANDQTFLDHYALYVCPMESQAPIHWEPESLVLEGTPGQWGSGTIQLHSDNPPSDIRLQASDPDQSIAVYPMQFSAQELESGQAVARVEARIDSTEKIYQIACWPDTGNQALAHIPVIARSFEANDSIPNQTPDSISFECPPPTLLQVSGIKSNSVQLQWESGTEESLVRIGNLFSVICQERIRGHQLNIENLDPGIWYWWEVASLCENGDSSAYAKGQNFQTPAHNMTRNHDGNPLALAMTFPNPSSGSFRLFLPYGCQVRIFTLQGQCVYAEHLSKGVHNLHIGTKGTFILRYGNHPDSEQSLKILIQ